jgi:hypothetical protein
MAEQVYTVVYGPTWWECMIKIDHGHVITVGGTEEKWSIDRAMQEMIIFWSDGKERLKLNEGDITKTFLQQLAREICFILADYDYSLEGLIEKFNDREGYWPMDGSNGITIMEIDGFDIPSGEFEILPGTIGRRTRGYE